MSEPEPQSDASDAENPVGQGRSPLLRVASSSFANGFDWLVINEHPRTIQLQERPGLHDLSDIDVLLASGQTPTVITALEAAGFTTISRFTPGNTLARAGLRADARTTLRDPVSNRAVHLHERLFFSDRAITPLLHSFRPRRSLRPDDIPAPPVGAPMALDIMLRGNARRWTKQNWLLHLSAVLQRLDESAQRELIRSIHLAGFEPGAAASLIKCCEATAVELPAQIATWLDQHRDLPEVLLRCQFYRESDNGPGANAPSLPWRGRASLARRVWERLHVLKRRPMQFTRDAATRTDRYPLAFRFAKHWLGERLNLRILSFGCSSGEEVFTLRSYFPTAMIKGIDVDPRRIAKARARKGNDTSIVFDVAGTVATEPDGFYDALFCMAVFREPALESPSARPAAGSLMFGAFNKEIGELVRCLKPGGLLFVEHSNFRVADSQAAVQLRPVLHSDPPGSGLSPRLYGPNGPLVDIIDRSLGFARREA